MEATTKTDLARIFAALAGYIRGHWAVENHLHWQSDVTINEDRSRKRVDHSAGNYSRLNRWALNPLKRDKSIKASIRSKRYIAGWDKNYLLRLISTWRLPCRIRALNLDVLIALFSLGRILAIYMRISI